MANAKNDLAILVVLVVLVKAPPKGPCDAPETLVVFLAWKQQKGYFVFVVAGDQKVPGAANPQDLEDIANSFHNR